ncbi:MAG: hypothetical protein AAFR26_24040 [Cyanobacteria bacterium J06626_4]
MTPQELQTQVIQLPIADRWRLVQTLLASIQQETQPATTATNQQCSAEPEIEAAIAQLHPWTQSLIGILPTTSEDPQDTYIDYLEEKYA